MLNSNENEETEVNCKFYLNIALKQLYIELLRVKMARAWVCSNGQMRDAFNSHWRGRTQLTW